MLNLQKVWFEMPKKQRNLLAALPSVDTVLLAALRHPAAGNIRRDVLTALIRESLDELRAQMQSGRIEENTREALLSRATSLVEKKAADLLRPSMQRVINCTGVILHTGLGRAVFPPEARAAATRLLDGYVNLEFDLETGRRGDRTAHVETLVCRLTGAEAACVVNNNAAAVLLALNTLANRKEVIISRGELVEIGGSFRIPEVMRKSGAKMIEVGTTNKTHLSDYVDAITPRTAGILRVHASNYRVLGFTAEVSLREVTRIAHEHDLFVLHDLGGGILIDLRQFGLPYEPVVAESLAAGCDVVTFSGDKVLGGPQAGLIVGKKAFIQRLKRNPMMRALRADKVTYALLEPTLRLFLQPSSLSQQHTVLRMLSEDAMEIRKRAESVYRRLATDFSAYRVNIVASRASAGSGALPLENIPSYAIEIEAVKGKVGRLAQRLRRRVPAIVGYIENNRLYLDVRTVLPDELDEVVSALREELLR